MKLVHYSTFDFDLGDKVNQNVAQYPLHRGVYSLASFEGAHVQLLRRRCIYEKIHYSTFDLDLGVTQNVAQYPLHHLTIHLQSLKLQRQTV